MLKLIITWYEKALDAMTKRVKLDKLIDMPIPGTDRPCQVHSG